ncbi:hypothetical protein [Pseudothauera rhizosphaerae]|uniref:Uncharacterized protein n=1 Tax=Pseudothauera rhizosphaerae TaxID=2565932 RepID=A0A4S4AAK1_9RHOO|nr:hypothetical protein [Pseudothauera rhizosphaerae]THF55909.1 hypothetical protein E6O51_20195 [Pseudothauera rhizosphaerae]
MAASDLILYAANLDDIRLNDLVGATLKMTLHTSSYTPDDGTSGDAVYADIDNELTTANGYTAGGATLTNVAVTAITNGWKLTSDNVQWNADGGAIPAWRYAVLRVSGSLWGKTDPLIGYIIADATPADSPATADGNPLQLEVPSGGWFDVKRV